MFEGLFGSGTPGLTGAPGQSPKWADALAIIGAMLQDVGTARYGGQGTSLAAVQKTLKDRRATATYQDTLNSLFAPAGSPADLPPVTPAVPDRNSASIADLVRYQKMKDALATAPATSPGGPLAGMPGADALATTLRGVPMEQGYPLLANAIAKRAEGQPPIKGAPGDVFLDPNTYKPVASIPKQQPRPATAAEIAALGLPKETSVQVKADGNYEVLRPEKGLQPPSGFQFASDGKTLQAIRGGPDDPAFAAQKAKAISDAMNSGFGRGMEGHAYSVLADGLKDPARRTTAEYKTSWQILSNPRVDPITGTIVTPDLSAFLPPIDVNQTSPAAQQGGAPPQRMPSVQSFAPPNPSQAEAASAGYANRLADSAGIIDATGKAGASLAQRAKAGLPLGNYLVSPEFQQFDQASRNFINAQLRRESGAVISEEEFANARKQYLPQPGDSREVLAQKKSARDMAVRNMQLSAGNVLMAPGTIQQSSPGRGAPVVPMTQGFAPPQPANAGTPAAQAAPAPTATGPNGQRLILQNGQWVPLR